MCIPYIIPDPAPRRRPRPGSSLARAHLPQDARVKPAYVEISPRLTYIASPKSDRSPIPPKIASAAQTPRRSPMSQFLDGFAAGEEASRQEEGRASEEKATPAVEAPRTPPSGKSPMCPPEPPDAPPAAKTKDQQRQPPLPRFEQPPTPKQPADTPFTPNPRTDSLGIHRQKPSYHSTHSPHSYVRRPPNGYHNSHRSRSPSTESTISRQSFERMKRNVHVLLDRLRALEAWKTEKELETRYRRKGLELGPPRREASMIRERRERERGRERERQRNRERDSVVVRDDEIRWDWEGGGLGRR